MPYFASELLFWQSREPHHPKNVVDYPKLLYLDAMAKTIVYWVATSLLVVGQGAAAIMELTHHPTAVEGIVALGYPTYLLTIIGIGKTIGVVFLALPKFNRLREWAYVGFGIDFVGACLSYVLNGDSFGKMLPALVAIIILCTSYSFLPENRRLIQLKRTA